MVKIPDNNQQQPASAPMPPIGDKYILMAAAMLHADNLLFQPTEEPNVQESKSQPLG